MPYRKTSVRRRHRRGGVEALNWPQVLLLLSGAAWAAEDGALFESEAHRRKAWTRDRAQLMRWWFEGIPASEEIPIGGSDLRGPRMLCRPFGWWLYEAPERRRIVKVGDVTRPLEPLRAARAADVARIWANAESTAAKAGYEPAFLGVPAMTCGAGCFECESEQTYLARLGLLTDDELAAVRIAAT